MPRSFTAAFKGRVNALICPCKIASAFNSKAPPAKRAPFGPYDAIWDTGASHSVINQRVVDQCGLKPVGMVLVRNANATHKCEVYVVNIMLTNGMVFEYQKVTKQNLSGADALIGMDVIGEGDLAVTNFDGKTVFSFRMPSMECIDFVRGWGEGGAGVARPRRGG
jgi:hypothetical protein